MGDVVNFRPPEPEYCYVCGCGSQDFILMYGGLLECSGCRCLSSKMIWMMIPPEIVRETDG